MKQQDRLEEREQDIEEQLYKLESDKRLVEVTSASPCHGQSRGRSPRGTMGTISLNIGARWARRKADMQGSTKENQSTQNIIFLAHSHIHLHSLLESGSLCCQQKEASLSKDHQILQCLYPSKTTFGVLVLMRELHCLKYLVMFRLIPASGP